MRVSSTQPTVLVVDDAPANLTMVTNALKPHFRTRVATNGERALTIANSEPVDLILLDVVMPGIDGYEVCRRLKENPATAEIPIIFLTADTSDQNEQLGFALGGVDYIHKPFSAPIVVARVNTHLTLQAALREARDQHATLGRVMAGMADGLIAARMDGTIAYFNEQASQFLRADLKKFAAQSLLEVFEQSQYQYADPERARAAWVDIISSPEHRPAHELSLAGSPAVDLLIHGFPLPGEAVSMFGVLIHDVTAEREVVRQKDEMMRFLGHELRAPLASMLGFADLMRGQEFGPDKRDQFLGTIVNEGWRLSALIDDFLDLERLAAVGSQLQLSPVRIGDVVQRTVETAGRDEARPIVAQVPPDLPAVIANADRVLQVLTNLISNARKYSPEGGEVRITAYAVDGFVEVTVADHGLGFPSEAQGKLFQKFYRISSPKHMAVKGTGLGLAICREIIEAQGGRVWATSSGPGQGSTFGFSLRSSRAEEAPHD